MAQKILVLSGKGGVGKSTAAACLATALARLGKTSLLIDADVGFRSLDLILGVGSEAVYNWLDVINANCDGEAAPVRVSEYVSLLCAPSQADGITAGDFSRLLETYDGGFDYILADAPAGSGEFHGILASVCDCALLVVTPDPVCVRSADSAMRKALAVNPELDTKLLINRFNRLEVLAGRQLKLDDVIDITRTQLIGVIPESDSIRLLSSGEQLTKYASSAFDRCAKRLAGESVPFRIKDFY